MPRYFLALPLPVEASQRLIALQPADHPSFRLIPLDELHLTLHFLGELTDSELRSACRKLTEVQFARFSIELRGVGQFPFDGPARVLWAGIEWSSELRSLYEQLGNQLHAAFGFVPDERPYHPHVTLARVNGVLTDDVVKRFLEANRVFEMPPIELKNFALFRSELINEIPQYAAVAVFDLVPPREKGSAGQTKV